MAGTSRTSVRFADVMPPVSVSVPVPVKIVGPLPPLLPPVLLKVTPATEALKPLRFHAPPFRIVTAEVVLICCAARLKTVAFACGSESVPALLPPSMIRLPGIAKPAPVVFARFTAVPFT